jgi:hypothetical protein
MTHGAGGRGAGFKEVVITSPKQGGGAMGSTKSSNRGQESGHKKPTMGLVIYAA